MENKRRKFYVGRVLAAAAIAATDGAVLQTGDGTVVESFYEIETDSDAPLSIEVEASGVELTEAAGDTPVTYEVREAAE